MPVISACIPLMPSVALFCVIPPFYLLEALTSAGDGTWVFFSDGRRCSGTVSGGLKKSRKPPPFTDFGKKLLRLPQPDCRRRCSAGDARRAGQVRATSPCKGRQAVAVAPAVTRSALSSCSAALAGQSCHPTVSLSHLPFIVNPSDIKVRELKGRMKQRKAGPCGQ